MEKWNGLKVGEYEIIDENTPEEDGYEYEEMSVENLLEKTQTDKYKFLQQYASVNIHYLLARETYHDAFDLIRRVAEEKRDQVKAIVFLALKPKGPRNTYHQLNSVDDYKALVKYANDFGVGVGMDSCSAPMAYKAYEGTKDEAMARNCIEPCESGLFSLYANSKGIVFPCSFSEGTPGWEQGLDILELARTKKEFIENIWFSKKMNKWRENLLSTTDKCTACKFREDCRSCPIYKVSNCN